MLLSLLALAAFAGEVLVDVLDVGQGDAVLIRGGGKAVLIDAGTRESDVVGQLGQLGIERLDLVVATHPHADHIGDMRDVVTTFEVGLFLDNGLPHTTQTYEELMAAIEERQIRYRAAERGLKLNLGTEASFTVLFPTGSPLTNTRSDLNSNSVVLWLDHGEVDVLFTGDSEEPTEQALLSYGIDEVDVLKVAHHGSGHSSTPRFLAALRPRYALISCGSDNRYGHPDPEALDRLRHVGAQVYRTDLSGNLRVVSDGFDVEVLEGSIEELDAVRIVHRDHSAPSPTTSQPVAAIATSPSAPSTTSAPDATPAERTKPPTRKELRRQRRAERRAARSS